MTAYKTALELSLELAEESGLGKRFFNVGGEDMVEDRVNLQVSADSLGPELMQVLADRGFTLEYLGPDEQYVPQFARYIIRTDGEVHENVY